MALVLKDRVKETSTTTGTGTITLAGAVAGFQSFAAVGNGNTTYYAIVDPITGDWEVGLGTYTSSGTTLSRTTVLSSSNSGSLVNFAANQKDVFVTYPSEKSVYEDASNVVNATSFGAITATSAALTTGTVSTTPASNTDIANKQYVDGLVTQGISYHEPVYVESPNTTGNLNATYNNGASGVGATLTNAGTQAALTVDGILMTVGKRVLIYNQTNAAQNGVYTVTTVGDGSTNWVLTRATDANTYGLRDPNALGYNDAFFVTNGNTGAGETYVCTTTGTITFGTTNITFAQISSAQVYTAGTGLNLSPATTFNISNTGVSASTYGSASAVPVFAVNAQGQLTSVTNTNIAISGSAVSGNIAGSAGSVANALTLGSYLTGTSFNGSSAVTATVDATTTNTASKVVARDSNGDFSAGTITATLSGNASTATAATNIAGGAANRIPYNTASGTTAFIVAPTTGSTFLSWNGSAFTYSAISTPASVTFNNGGTGDVSGTSFNGSTARTISYNTVGAPSTGGTGATGTWGISISGNAATATSATSATSATTATNLAGGGAGQLPYNTGSGATSFLAAGTSGYVLQSNGTAAPSWVVASTAAGVNNGTLTMNVSGTGLSGSQTFTANQAGAATFTVTSNATSANTASTIVARDASGNFTAGTITAALNGNASTATSATSATTATTATQVANALTAGSYLTSAGTFTGAAARTFAVDATSANTASKVVARDGSGNFSAGTITATLNGSASSASTSTTQSKTDASTNIATTAFSKWMFATTGTGGTLNWDDSSNTIPGVGTTLLLGTATNGPGGSNYYHPFNIEYSGITGAGNVTQMAIAYGAPANELWMRGRYSGSWSSWVRYLNSSNYNSYAPTLTGTGASGTWGIAVTGNAGTATTLQTARTINGTSFNGSANITITANTTNTLTLGSYLTGTSFNGSAAVTAAVDATSANTASKVVARDASGNFSAGTITASLSGNATTATTATNLTNFTAATSANGSNVDAPTTLDVVGYCAQAGLPFSQSDGGLYTAGYSTSWYHQIFGDFRSGQIAIRGKNSGTWQSWRTVLDSSNYTSYAPTLTGTGASGTWGISISGNAATATALQTARTINGTSFNGTANITVTANTTNALTLGSYLTGTSFNGSSAVTAAVDATSANTASKVVARDASGNFSAGTITAALSGNATTATTATNATNVAVTTSSTASAFKVPFANTTASTTGNYGLLQDSTATFTYNPSTNVLTVGTVSGALSGNATTATSAATWTTARTLTIGATGKSVNGSANVSWTLAEVTGTTAAPQFGSLGIGTAASGTTGEIRATNNVTAYYSSDIKFKENVRNIPNAAITAAAIGGKLFDWKAEYIEEHGGEDGYFIVKSDFGVIAQDVLAKFPVAVRTRPDGSLAVDYEKLSALALAANAEHEARISKLEALVAKLIEG